MRVDISSKLESTYLTNQDFTGSSVLGSLESCFWVVKELTHLGLFNSHATSEIHAGQTRFPGTVDSLTKNMLKLVVGPFQLVAEASRPTVRRRLGGAAAPQVIQTLKLLFCSPCAAR